MKIKHLAIYTLITILLCIVTLTINNECKEISLTQILFLGIWIGQYFGYLVAKDRIY